VFGWKIEVNPDPQYGGYPWENRGQQGPESVRSSHPTATCGQVVTGISVADDSVTPCGSGDSSDRSGHLLPSRFSPWHTPVIADRGLTSIFQPNTFE